MTCVFFPLAVLYVAWLGLVWLGLCSVLVVLGRGGCRISWNSDLNF